MPHLREAKIDAMQCQLSEMLPGYSQLRHLDMTSHLIRVFLIVAQLVDSAHAAGKSAPACCQWLA